VRIFVVELSLGTVINGIGQVRKPGIQSECAVRGSLSRHFFRLVSDRGINENDSQGN
jgi:hypothetical protein